MKSAVIIVAALMGFAPMASFAQIVTPQLTPPPCTGNHCLSHARGTHIETGAANPHGAPCPPGTKFNPVKGTCKVMPEN